MHTPNIFTGDAVAAPRGWRRRFASGYDPPMDEFHDNCSAAASVAAGADALILVDEADREVGLLSKARAMRAAASCIGPSRC